MVRWATVVLAALVCAQTGGCKQSKPKPEPAENQRAKTNRPDPPAESERQSRLGTAGVDKKVRRRVLVGIEPGEVREALPAIVGADVILEPRQLGPGRQVKAEYCIGGGGVDDVAKKVRAALEAAGWSGIHQRPHRKLPNRVGMSGQKPPLRLTAAIARVPNPKCNEIDDKTLVSFTFHKVLTPDHAKAAQSEAGAKSP